MLNTRTARTTTMKLVVADLSKALYFFTIDKMSSTKFRRLDTYSINSINQLPSENSDAFILCSL